MITKSWKGARYWQGEPFFEPQDVRVGDTRITVEIKQVPNCNLVYIIKNSHPIQMGEVKVDFDNERDHSESFIKKYEDILPYVHCNLAFKWF